ncbi:HAD-IIB family hydrolase [Jannaschia seohaensis]|uniref:HAD superfamily hydrolase (TIGR01484 family) n=1 Tax=Jannaschia seohaensis TaxID=475081 RepID=A0A2Y9BVZ0_9RHOB|nr:HAD-IIB family hydrolase [Jannaschia seohaensis]PWJ21894.1 HAD superfamily hydrolase (TIGR01484 family) [Jannaschia seohaensis]SSA38172.1 HAD-superfamily hydrolase, subfamily IIB [Jannaschia seohaensis]
MTRHETFPFKAIKDKEMVLATDLDGTFLGGTDEECAKFYSWIQANRDSVGLIFVTGRDPGFIRELTTKRGVPRPDYVVGDVGTTIAEVEPDGMLRPIDALESEISERWGDASGRVQAALHSVSGLKLQSTGFRYRVSYDMDPERFDSRALDIVAGLGLDALVSDNRFFDVLPKDVSKGPSLLRLLAHLEVENARTLVAGDTLNDLSMLALGLPAVAVGGSEPALIEKLDGEDHVHIAKGIGVSGIAEAILAHKLLSAS